MYIQNKENEIKICSRCQERLMIKDSEVRPIEDNETKCDTCDICDRMVTYKNWNCISFNYDNNELGKLRESINISKIKNIELTAKNQKLKSEIEGLEGELDDAKSDICDWERNSDDWGEAESDRNAELVEANNVLLEICRKHLTKEQKRHYNLLDGVSIEYGGSDTLHHKELTAKDITDGFNKMMEVVANSKEGK